jgi:hypothetical protein
MPYVLVLVGGTGQRFGLGLGYLNLLGIAEMPERVVIVDAEGARSISPVSELTKQLLVFGQPNEEAPSVLAPYNDSGQAGAIATIQRCITTRGSALFPLTITEEEASLEIQEGFYAVPKLAAVVFRDLRNKNPTKVSRVLGAPAQLQGKNVIIVGSVSGGTGAGILREVASYYYRDPDPGPKVFGIVFSQYFMIPSGTQKKPTDADLARNSALGCDFLLNQDTISPFHALTVVGPPAGAKLPPPIASKEAMPHGFPGFLAALSLVADGGARLAKAYQQRKTDQGQKEDTRLRLTWAFGARTKGEKYLHEEDIAFPVKGTGEQLDLRDLRLMARAAQAELKTFGTFPFAAAGAGSSLFATRKLGASLARTMRCRGKGRILPTLVAGLGGRIATVHKEARDGLERFLAWLDRSEMAAGLGPSGEHSLRVGRRAWRSALAAAPQRNPAEIGAIPEESLARVLCMDVTRGQATPARLEGGDSGGQWMFAHTSGGAAGAGKAGQPKDFSTTVEVGDIESSAYPTPLGQALAFTKALQAHDDWSKKAAETLWLSLALGWLELQIVDLKTATSEYDKLVVQIEGDHSRFTGVLKVADLDTLPESLRYSVDEQKKQVQALIGGTYPTCGLWPGVRDDIRKRIASLSRLLDEGDNRQKALRVLRTWCREVKKVVPGIDDNAPWWRLVTDLTALDQRDVEDPANLRTRGPVLLTVGADGTQEPLYVFSLEANRVGRCARVLELLERQTPEQLGFELPTVNDSNGNFSAELTLRAGYLDLSPHIDRTSEPKDEDPLKTVARPLLIPQDVLKRWKREVPISVERPDITWTRSRKGGENEVDHHIQVVGNPPDPNRPCFLSNVVAGVPASVKDAYYHPGRKCWVVWLRDPIAVPGSCATRLRDTPTVRIEKDGKVWDLRFPNKTLFLNPRDIFVTDSFQFKTAAGPVRPTVPVRCEYLDLVECVDGLQPSQAGSDLPCKVRLVGGLETDWVLPESKLTPIENLHVEFWPNISHPDWKRFWLAVESDQTDPIKKVQCYAVYEKSEHGYYRRCSLTSNPQQSFYESFLGRPRLLWVGQMSLGAGGVETWAHGGGFTVFNKTGEYPATEKTATIAVDFGSSRTALMVAEEGSMGGDASGGSGTPLDACRLAVVSNEKAAEAQRAQETVLPPNAASEKKATARDKATGYASQIYGSTLLYVKDGHLPDERSIPFRDYTIPVRLMESLDEYPDLTGKPDAGLKWAGGSTASSARKAYIKAILAVGAVEAFSRGASRLNVRHSFPLAHSRPEEIHDAFEVACAWLKDDVIDTSSNKTGVAHQLVDSESGAGMTAAQAFGDWLLTLDLGGGTLDLGLFVDEGGKPKAKAWDSVKLGGNLVAAAVTVRTKTNERWLRWEISEGRLQADKDLIQDADLLLRLSMEYAARFVAGSLLQAPNAASGAPIEMRVVLLGSGWRWYQVVSQQRKRFDEKGFDERFGTYLAKRIDALAGDTLRGKVKPIMTASLLATGQEKLAVVQGLARMPAQSVDTRMVIEAPNGLLESGRPWTQMVGKKYPLGRPASVQAEPPFADDLEKIASLKDLGTGSTNMELLSQLRDLTQIDNTRTRTALGLGFEALTGRWFGLEGKQERTPEPVAVPTEKAN